MMSNVCIHALQIEHELLSVPGVVQSHDQRGLFCLGPGPNLHVVDWLWPLFCAILSLVHLELWSLSPMPCINFVVDCFALRDTATDLE
jgi:hypothetical protein